MRNKLGSKGILPSQLRLQGGLYLCVVKYLMIFHLFCYIAYIPMLYRRDLLLLHVLLIRRNFGVSSFSSLCRFVAHCIVPVDVYSIFHSVFMLYINVMRGYGQLVGADFFLPHWYLDIMQFQVVVALSRNILFLHCCISPGDSPNPLFTSADPPTLVAVPNRVYRCQIDTA